MLFFIKTLKNRNAVILTMRCCLTLRYIEIAISGVASQLCARGRAMKLAPPAPSLFFQISKFSFEILEFKFE